MAFSPRLRPWERQAEYASLGGAPPHPVRRTRRDFAKGSIGEKLMQLGFGGF